MPMPTSHFIGSWNKITPSECSRAYPDTIRFQENGLYFGHKEPPGTFTRWDAGTFEVVGPRQVKISTANDAILSYEFSIVNDLMTFIDAEGCECSYRRVS